MKFGPKFNKMFVAYPAIDKSSIIHNRITKLTRKEMYTIIKGMKANGVETPNQPTRTTSYNLRAFINDEMKKLTR